MKRAVAKNPHMHKRAIQAFQTRVYKEARAHRRVFPWRETHDPYRIFVSEIMLQQTQAGARTTSKYLAFTEQFPTIESLASSSLAPVLKIWQGLGYNRRAKYLRDAARILVNEHSGRVPQERAALEALPGVGPYTAAAVEVFAFNKPAVMIETNIRTVYLHHFFKHARRKIPDAEILQYIVVTMDQKNPRNWYTALLDYGAALKREGKSYNNKSAHYVIQKPFKGSRRQLRGKILRELSQKNKTEAALAGKLSDQRVKEEIQTLIRDGLVARRGRNLVLAD